MKSTNYPGSGSGQSPARVLFDKPAPTVIDRTIDHYPTIFLAIATTSVAMFPSKDAN